MEKLLITVEVTEMPPGNQFDVLAAVQSKHWYKRLLGLKDYYPLQIVALNKLQDQASE